VFFKVGQSYASILSPAIPCIRVWEVFVQGGMETVKGCHAEGSPLACFGLGWPVSSEDRMDWEHSGMIEQPDWEDDQYDDEEPEINDDFPMYLEYDDWKYDHIPDQELDW
jgi:hypothetical protein